MATATGSPITWAYGYVWGTGKRLQYRMLQNTNNDNLDWTRVGMWGLGAGEWDGCEELWDSGVQRLLYTSENDDPTHFHFHRGCDAIIGSGNTPSSSGPDQGVDDFWTWFPAGVERLHYHRIAYYALFLKLQVSNPSGEVHQSDPDDWTDLNPIGLWRGLRCRLFDAQGTMTGYAFTTNPAWHFVDMLLRRKIMPEYYLDINNGPDDLTAAVRSRFDWSAIADAASYFDEILPNGNRRTQGSYAFAQQTTLQACLSQILQVSRSYMRERSGKLGLYPDRQRSSVFTFSRKEGDTFTANDTDLHNAANRYVANFRDLLIPSAADVAGITRGSYADPVVTTVNPHPFAVDDRIVIGGTGTKYDGNWVVASVPDASSVTTFTMTSKGQNYPSAVGAGGKIGLLYTRFKERAPEFNHHRHQLAKGAIGVGIERQRNKVKLETDFATSTYDQVSRVSYYMRRRALGADTVPYVTPVTASLTTTLFTEDAAGSGNIAIGIEPGDRVTVDETLSAAYAGDYEVVQVNHQLSGSTMAQDGSMRRSPIAGTVTLSLGPYSDDNFPDSTNLDEAGWDNVPGSEPGNDSNYTTIDLDDGEAAFWTGSGASSTTFSMPNAGFNAANILAWASPQGYIAVDAHLHYIANCGADVPTRQLHLIYDDSDGTTWTGDLNFAALTWRTLHSASLLSAGGCSFVELTLSGGELVCFGMGTIGASAAVPLPSGYTRAQSIMLALPHSASDSGHPAHGVRGYVGVDGVAHHDYQDGSGNSWQGDVHPFVFAWRNNKGTVISSNGWVSIPLATGKVLAVCGISVLDNRLGGGTPANYPNSGMYKVSSGGKLPLPPGLTSDTLQVLPMSESWTDIGHPAHGVRESLVDGDLNVLTSFEDGETNLWYGSSEVFGLICDVLGTVAPTNPIEMSAVQISCFSGGQNYSGNGTPIGSVTSSSLVVNQIYNNWPVAGFAGQTLQGWNLTPAQSILYDASGSLTGTINLPGTGRRTDTNFQGTFRVNVAGRYTFYFRCDDSWVFWVGGGATKVLAGINTLSGSSASIAGIASKAGLGAPMAGRLTRGTVIEATDYVVVDFPATGDIPFEIGWGNDTGNVYFVCTCTQGSLPTNLVADSSTWGSVIPAAS